MKLRLILEILALWLGCLLVLLATLGLSTMREPWQEQHWQDEDDNQGAA